MMPSPRDAAEVQNWLISQLAEQLRVGRQDVSLTDPIMSLGVDSVQVVNVMAKLEDWGGFRFEGNPLEEFPTIDALARHVAERISLPS